VTPEERPSKNAGTLPAFFISVFAHLPSFARLRRSIDAKL
jgi:hypothetical protein